MAKYSYYYVEVLPYPTHFLYYAIFSSGDILSILQLARTILGSCGEIACTPF